ncbi:hypothetical protein GCM10010472_65020 [Pseudonocardia halophobica]|uniref:Uncharacterized protein n=1 Tax=Pseudonocardia halophobica TaxID=29401 RepID=A0A9W6P166_9PSEU|nr:hypothetical protein GCM10017577_70490 [Pseudonocardia halophobica]
MSAEGVEGAEAPAGALAEVPATEALRPVDMDLGLACLKEVQIQGPDLGLHPMQVHLQVTQEAESDLELRRNRTLDSDLGRRRGLVQADREAGPGLEAMP